LRILLHPGVESRRIASTNSIPPNEEAGETESCADATDTPIIMPTDTPPKRHFVKTNQANLVKMMPLGTDYGMV
jgi:hypothetical protein